MYSLNSVLIHQLLLTLCRTLWMITIQKPKNEFSISSYATNKIEKFIVNFFLFTFTLKYGMSPCHLNEKDDIFCLVTHCKFKERKNEYKRNQKQKIIASGNCCSFWYLKYITAHQTFAFDYSASLFVLRFRMF